MPDDVLVLGGGISGLAVADAWSREGGGVTVLEAQPELGGLLRSHTVGGHVFDTGPHAIYTHDPAVHAWFLDLLGEALVPLSRNSYTLFRGRRVPYPLTVGAALRALGVAESACVLWEAALARALRRPPPPDPSFEEWARHAFGGTLFRLFFERYTEKVWGLPCRDLSAAWISVHLPANSLLKVLVDRLKGRNLPIGFVSRFHYSARGSGALVDALVARLRSRGCVSLRAGARVLRVSADPHGFRVMVEQGGRREELRAPLLVSTIPPGVLLQLLDPAPPPDVLQLAAGIRFRNLLLVSMVVSKPRVSDANWVYAPDPAVEIARVSEFKNMITSMQARPDTSLQTETFCWPEDPVWRAADEEIVGRAVAGLEALGLARSVDIREARVTRVPNAYPVFDRLFEGRMRAIREHLSGIRGLHLLGRTGAFLYLDQAGCVAQAFQWAREQARLREPAA